MSKSLLLSLPEELIAVIAAAVIPESILSLALVCKQIYRHLKHRLAAHHEYEVQYKVLHDRRALTVPTLLRLAIRNPEAAWHIRAFESWELRPGFKTWKTRRNYYGIQINGDDKDSIRWAEPKEDFSELDENFFEQHEWNTMRQIMADDLCLSAEDVAFWIQKAREGWQEPLKGMLFALSPRLDRLNYIAYDSWQFNSFPVNHPMTFLCTAIRSVHNNLRLGIRWPAAFESLRIVSVCTSTEVRHPHDAYYAQLEDIAPLFYLPNIKALNFTLLGYLDDAESQKCLPPKCSSVEELQFSCCSLDSNAWKQLLQAPRKLRKLNMASSDGYDGDVIRKCLAEEHSDTLEWIALDKYGDRPDIYFKQFQNLKVIDRIKVADLLFTDQHNQGIVCRAKTEYKIGELGHFHTRMADLREFLPSSLERVMLEYNVTRHNMRSFAVRGEMLRAVADLVEDDRFTNLTSVCIRKLWTEHVGRNQDPAWDTDALARIEARGIETHLRDEAGQIMPYSEHRSLHRGGNSAGLIEVETDPRGANEFFV